MYGCSRRSSLVSSVIRRFLSLGETLNRHIIVVAPQHSGALTPILLKTSSDPAGMVERVRRGARRPGQGRIRVYAASRSARTSRKLYAQSDG